MKLTILTTGGTIEKTYSERDGTLQNRLSVLDQILDQLRLPDVFIRLISVVQKDSLDLTDEDRQMILDAVRDALPGSDAVLVIHGTDTLSLTGELLFGELSELTVPVVLTGAMRPYEFRDTDALQNVTEALLACRVVTPGVWVALHNRVLAFPGVIKDRQAMTFRRRDDC